MQGKPVKFAVQGSLVAVAVLALILVARHWTFERLSLTDYFLLPCLVAMCLGPGIGWYRRGMEWLPLGEVFAAYHLVFFVMPCLDAEQKWLPITPSEQSMALVAVGVFLGAFLAAYRYMVEKPCSRARRSAMFLQRKVAPGAIWVMFSIWLAWSILLRIGLLPNLGNALNIYWASVSAAGILAVLYLSFQIGQRTLPKLETRLVFGGLVLGLMLNFASGFLNGAGQWLAAALLGFTLGRKRVPVKTLVFCTALLAILQLGKADYRKIYWSRQNQGNVAPNSGLLERYTFWLSAGWKNSWHSESTSAGDTNAGLTARANLLPVLATAIKTAPDEKPFLTGQTYLQFFPLMVPRIFWPGKPRGTLPTETIGIYIGIQTPEGAKSSSIAVGPICEAWINFGWIGLLAAGGFLGALFGLPARLSKSLIPSQVGWLIAAIFLTYSANLENTLVEMMCSMFTTLVPGVALLLLISRPQAMRRWEAATT
jgi:hypothetical protein